MSLREVLRVIGERVESENLLREFIEDTTAPEVCLVEHPSDEYRGYFRCIAKEHRST